MKSKMRKIHTNISICQMFYFGLNLAKHKAKVLIATLQSHCCASDAAVTTVDSHVIFLMFASSFATSSALCWTWRGLSLQSSNSTKEAEENLRTYFSGVPT